MDNLLNDSDRSSSEFNKQQNIIVYYTPPGGHPSEAIPHSLSWSKEPKLTASCLPDILQNDRNGPSQVIIQFSPNPEPGYQASVGDFLRSNISS